MAAPARPAPTADAGGWSAAAARLAPETVPGPRVGAELDAVLFDAGGVIVVPDPFSTGPALAPFGATSDVATLIRAHYAGMRAHATSTAGDAGIWLDYLRAHIAETGVPADRADEALGA
ncbi:MAG TPA: hypothetical protein VGO60_11080, partial [Iamia sp.]|nr:hypothetical protein [Iamia sp.]